MLAFEDKLITNSTCGINANTSTATQLFHEATPSPDHALLQAATRHKRPSLKVT